MRSDPFTVPTVNAQISVIDVALPWLREDAFGNPRPDVDWRFHVKTDSFEVTFAEGATAAQVAAYLQTEGVPVEDRPER